MTWKRLIESVIFLFSVLALVYLVIPGTLNEKNSVVAGIIDPILEYLDEVLPSSPQLAAFFASNGPPAATPATPAADHHPATATPVPTPATPAVAAPISGTASSAPAPVPAPAPAQAPVAAAPAKPPAVFPTIVVTPAPATPAPAVTASAAPVAPTPAPAPAAPAVQSPLTHPPVALPPAAPPAASPTPAPAAPHAAVPAPLTPLPPVPASTPTSQTVAQGVGCIVVGGAGLGSLLVAGPGQLVVTLSGGTLLQPQPALVAGLVGVTVAAGCAVGAVAAPVLIQAADQASHLTQSLLQSVAGLFPAPAAKTPVAAGASPVHPAGWHF